MGGSDVDQILEESGLHRTLKNIAVWGIGLWLGRTAKALRELDGTVVRNPYRWKGSLPRDSRVESHTTVIPLRFMDVRASVIDPRMIETIAQEHLSLVPSRSEAR